MFGVVLNEVGLASRIMYYLLKFAGTKVKRLSFILAVDAPLLLPFFMMQPSPSSWSLPLCRYL
jgi:solute carrier family 13 (sodium-dependent dicarboxylate transporter), member 2/3/5